MMGYKNFLTRRELKFPLKSHIYSYIFLDPSVEHFFRLNEITSKIVLNENLGLLVVKNICRQNWLMKFCKQKKTASVLFNTIYIL